MVRDHTQIVEELMKKPYAARTVATKARQFLLATALAFALGKAAAAAVFSGFLAGEDPITISSPGDFTNTTTLFPFSGHVETKASLSGGDWQFHLSTSSEVTNVAISGGELIEATAEIAVNRVGQFAGPGPFPSSVTQTGYLVGNVIVGTNSLHDGALIFGSFAINSLEDLFFPDAGEYPIDIPLSVSVPVSASGSFPVTMRIRSESWGRVGLTSADFSHTFALTSILLPNGNTPESEGWSLSFDDGAISPNVPEPSTSVLLTIGVVVCLISSVRRGGTY
jgi:hypothetical protein